MIVPLLAGTVWACPRCGIRGRQKVAAPTGGGMAAMHECRALGIVAPLVPEGTDCVVETNEREDMIGDEIVRYNRDGRPIMNVVTRYADGRNDLMVFAPTAKGKFNA